MKFYELVLNLYDFEVKGIAKNGEEAINIFKSFKNKPDIILMDYRMPIKDGIQASKEILKIDENAKIIFASADHSIKKYVLSIGVLDFLSKPFTNEKLIGKIKKILTKSEKNTIT